MSVKPLSTSVAQHASQQEALHHRGVGKAQKIRMRVGGSPNMREAFPDKPKGMHWRTYDRLRRMHDVAEGRSASGLMRLVERLERRFARLEGADSAIDFDNSGGE